MARNVEFAPHEFYHIYNRGTEKRNIFLSRSDYERFSALLYSCNGTLPVRLDNIPESKQGRTLLERAIQCDRGTPLVEICAYVLMPNHFHLLIRERSDGGISKFMQKLLTGYTMYFNTRRERSGVLFQGKYKARHAHGDRYLAHLISYIHLNPVKLIEPLWKETGIRNRSNAERYLKQYTYSSYPDYLGQERTANKIITKDALPAYYESPKDFSNVIKEYLAYGPE